METCFIGMQIFTLIFPRLRLTEAIQMVWYIMSRFQPLVTHVGFLQLRRLIVHNSAFCSHYLVFDYRLLCSVHTLFESEQLHLLITVHVFVTTKCSFSDQFFMGILLPVVPLSTRRLQQKRKWRAKVTRVMLVGVPLYYCIKFLV